MKLKIPYKLKRKFINLEGLKSEPITRKEYYGFRIKELPYKVVLDLSNDIECLEACIKWQRVIQTYFKTSYKAYRLDIGPYEGIWPIDLKDGIVIFSVDHVYPDRKNWKDWFIKEDEYYAPTLTYKGEI